MRLAALAIMLVLVAGCAELPLLEPSLVDGAIAEALAAARAPVPEQRAALARSEQAFLKDPSAGNRLRLATLLAALPAPLRDDARALEILGPVADAQSAGAGRYAALLTLQVQERQRVARELDRSAKERERVAGERAAADKERDKREEALRQQLEALRSIERNILEREDRLRRKGR